MRRIASGKLPVLAIAMLLAVAPHAARAQVGARKPIVEPRPDPLAGTRAVKPQPAPQTRAEPGTFDGLVTDTTLAPIPEAEVIILRSSLRIRTGANGRFRFTRLPAGQYLVIVRRLGYHPTSGIVEVPANDTLRMSYSLAHVPQGMDTIRVVTERRSFRMMEFEDRRKLGEGQFLTQEQMERHNSAYATDLIRYFFNGITIKDAVDKGAGGGYLHYLYSRRSPGGIVSAGPPDNPMAQVQLPSGCPMLVIVDDVQMPTPFDLDQLPSPREIQGMELYSGPAEIPVRYNSLDARCGLLLIWTKDGP